MPRVLNFNSGPSALPLEVLEEVREELLDYRGTGASIVESSHRGAPYDAVHHETLASIRELLGLGPEWTVMLLAGGASLQFAQLPLNLLAPGTHADYVVAGHWGAAALADARTVGDARALLDAREPDGSYRRVPAPETIRPSAGAVYCHLTSNNTIEGTQMHAFPARGDVPFAVDMSSDFLSRPFDPAPFGLVYAGAQKNLGPAGMTVVLVREDVLARCRGDLPAMLAYRTQAAKDSLYNTPPVFPIYVTCLVLRWLKARGGVAGIERENRAKGALLYEAIDGSGGFYRGPVEPGSRSLMNVVFRLADPALEDRFVAAAEAAGIAGIRGHRAVGGLRVSIYNASGLESVRTMASFMTGFARANG